MRLLQILPRVPPSVCGVADYAWNLAMTLASEQGVHSTFLCAGTHGVAPSNPTAFEVHHLPTRTASGLSEWLATQRNAFDAILLHVSIYGFQKRGLPFWLAHGLGRKSDTAPLLAMFHELYSGGPPTTTAFWTQPFQKAVIRRLSRRAQGLLTNRAPYADLLVPLAGCARDEIKVMPVFSNLGEPSNVPPVSHRPAALAMYASNVHDGRSLPQAVEAAVTICRRFNLDTMHLLGRCNVKIPEPADIQFQQHGYLPSEEVSKILLQSQIAYCPYNPDYLGKSGLLASFAAHGLAVVTTGRQPCLPDGLRHDHEVWNEATLSDACLPPERRNSVGAGLHAWYHSHSRTSTAASVALQLNTLI